LIGHYLDMKWNDPVFSDEDKKDWKSLRWYQKILVILIVIAIVWLLWDVDTVGY
jgi:uncharacterized ion transporter superfamily protein YfcC